METFVERRLTGAACCHMDDMYFSRERSHFLQIVSFLSVVVRRVPLPQTWQTIFVIPGCAVDQPRIDVEKVNPNFVVAALISTPDSKRFVRDCV